MPSEHDPLPRLPVEDDLDPAIAAVLWRAYSEEVDVDTAARHLWRIHRAAARPVRARPRGARRILVAALTGLMLVLSAGGALAASADTVPGDALYSVKRGVERTRLVLALAPDSDARLYLAMARQRLSEAETAAVRRPAVLPRLIEDAAVSIEHAERTGSVAVLREAAVVREEASQKAVALALVVEDDAGKAQLIAAGERLWPPADDVVVAPSTPPDRVFIAPVELPPPPAEPPVETPAAETGVAETAPMTPPPTSETVPPSRPTPTASPSSEAATESPDESEDPESDEPEPKDGESGRQFEGELPPAEPKDGPGSGKDAQEIRPESAWETSESESGEATD